MGRLVSCFTIILFLANCKRSTIPSTIEQSMHIHVIEQGNVKMFNNPQFVVPIPSLNIQQYEVTNIAFKEFVHATHYITTAEKNDEGMVFDRKKKKWVLEKGANWQAPQGPGSHIDNKDFFPVVQISYFDACAYCDWLHMRLPYEAEWEYIFQKDFEKPSKSSNHWQGIFPIEDKGTDGFKGTSPVGNFGIGGTGCSDLQGNVWEWCIDNYHENWPTIGPQFPDSISYRGPSSSFSEDRMYDTLRVIKGGSFLCADNYCKGYTNQIRMGADPKLGYEHIGFRCVKKK